MVKDDLLLLLVDTESSRSLRYNIWKVWDLAPAFAARCMNVCFCGTTIPDHS